MRMHHVGVMMRNLESPIANHQYFFCMLAVAPAKGADDGLCAETTRKHHVLQSERPSGHVSQLASSGFKVLFLNPPGSRCLIHRHGQKTKEACAPTESYKPFSNVARHRVSVRYGMRFLDGETSTESGCAKDGPQADDRSGTAERHRMQGRLGAPE
jgi:hypothetical protein